MDGKIDTSWSHEAIDFGEEMRVEIHNAVSARINSPEFQSLTMFQQNMLLFHVPLAGLIGAVCSALPKEEHEDVLNSIMRAMRKAYDLASTAPADDRPH